MFNSSNTLKLATYLLA